MRGLEVSTLEKVRGKYLYRGMLWDLNKPIKSTSKNKKMMVLATKFVDGVKRARVIHFGALGYGHNYCAQAKKNYLSRSAGIKDKNGNLTKDDPWSANYWSRKFLWPRQAPATGPRQTRRLA